MDRELRAKFDLYLALKDGETEQEVIDRLYTILLKAENENKGFAMSQLYDHEIQTN